MDTEVLQLELRNSMQNVDMLLDQLVLSSKEQKLKEFFDALEILISHLKNVDIVQQKLINSINEKDNIIHSMEIEMNKMKNILKDIDVDSDF